MNSKQLLYFSVTVEKGSIAAAARELDIAQPAISQQLVNLEREMGAALLERSFKGVSLTPAGAIFARHAEVMLNEIEITRQALQQLVSEQAGRVRIGMLPSINNVLSMALIEQVTQRYPKLKLEISTGPSYSVKEWLETNQIDIAITYEQEISVSTMRCTPLITENMYLVVGQGEACKQYPALQHRQTIDFWELSQFELLTPGDKDALGRLIAMYEQTTSVALKHNRAYSGHLMTGLRQVMQGEGLMILPSSAMFHLEDSGLIKSIKITAPTMTRSVLMATRRCRPLSNAMLKMMDVIKDVVAMEQRANHWRGELAFTQQPERQATTLSPAFA